MKDIQLLLGKYFHLPNPGVRAYLNKCRLGNDIDYRSPLWDKAGRQTILSKGETVLRNLHFSERYPQLHAFELDMLAKAGPMSIQKPWNERESDLINYYTDVEMNSRSIPKSALDATVRKFKSACGIRIRSIENTVDNMRKSTNSGTPYFTTRNNVIDTTIYSISHYGQDPYYFRTDNGVWLNMAAVNGGRGQEGGFEYDDVKQRMVWMFPLSINIQELRCYQPCIEAMQKNHLIPAYEGMDAVDREVTLLFDTKGATDLVVCTDFTRFDQHFNPAMQGAAKYILEQLLTKDELSKGGLEDIFPIKFNIPMITPNKVYYGPHGMASGSGGTNFDECLSHSALQHLAAQEAGAILNPHSMAYGDDGVLTYPGIDPEHVSRVYSSVGQEANISKFHASVDDAIILRRGYGINYRVNGIMVGCYSTYRAINKLMTFERYYDPKKGNKEMVVLRSLSIIENCKGHPCFEQLIDFVLAGDEFRLGLNIEGFYDNLTKWVDYAQKNFRGLLGFTKEESISGISGIQTGSVVQYLLRLRQGKVVKTKNTKTIGG